MKHPLIVAVLGAGRSGSSCTAGVLHALGVSMGERVKRADKHNQRGYFEDLSIRAAVNGRGTPREKIAALRRWAHERAARHPEMFGVKYVRLCTHVPLMVRAWPHLKVIAIERPISEILQSYAKTPFPWSEVWVRRCIEARDRDLKRLGVTAMRLQYHDLLRRPVIAVRRIVRFLGIKPSRRQFRRAIAFIDPALRHEVLP